LLAIDEHRPAILGMSALLTTTMPYMGVVIEELDKRGILKELPVMVGGAPLNQEFADADRRTQLWTRCRDQRGARARAGRAEPLKAFRVRGRWPPSKARKSRAGAVKAQTDPTLVWRPALAMRSLRSAQAAWD
jgi:hypothetical protein